MTTSAHCHKVVAKVAREAAGELYERLMGEQQFYDPWREQNPGLSPKQLESRFIEKNWGKCIDFARATLACMLGRPDVPEALKEDIMEALVLDASLIRGRQNPMNVIGTVH
jgi:hypothetical protein